MRATADPSLGAREMLSPAAAMCGAVWCQKGEHRCVLHLVTAVAGGANELHLCE